MKSIHAAFYTLIMIWMSPGLMAYEASVTIETNNHIGKISPYIYGAQAFNNEEGTNLTALRQGGNRWTGYNWEINVSNAGEDWFNHSDYYLGEGSEFAGALLPYGEECKTHSYYCIVTLQMAGYVSADADGTVNESETAPSSRWKAVQSFKNQPLSLTPDIHDDAVYMDELVNYLIHQFGPSTAGGIKAYSLDNEPALWDNTHPRIHPTPPTSQKLVERSVELAKAIKSVDPEADIFGPALYGYSAFHSLDDDNWETLNNNQYDWYIDYYLDEMKKASDDAGFRLLDVLDIHWYPEAQGSGIRIIDDNNINDPNLFEARMQAPRSLWDSTYAEESWISKWMTPKQPVQNWSDPEPGPINLLQKLFHSIDAYYPDTKLAITEYHYGSNNFVADGIAQADFLGIAGRFDVFMTSKWYNYDNYVLSGFQIYRNYDGQNSTFGDIAVPANSSNVEALTSYASISEELNKLYIIAINKKDETASVTFDLGSTAFSENVEAWGFQNNQPKIARLNEAAVLDADGFRFNLPALSVTHLILDLETDVQTSSSVPLSSSSAPLSSSITPISSSLPGSSSVLTSSSSEALDSLSSSEMNMLSSSSQSIASLRNMNSSEKSFKVKEGFLMLQEANSLNPSIYNMKGQTVKPQAKNN